MSKFDMIEQHWSRGRIGEAALANAGKDPDNLKPQDLAAVVVFHIRERGATLELAPKPGLDASTSVLDLSGNIGGASRLKCVIL